MHVFLLFPDSIRILSVLMFVTSFAFYILLLYKYVSENSPEKLMLRNSTREQTLGKASCAYRKLACFDSSLVKRG